MAFRCRGRDVVDLLGRLSTNDLGPLDAGRAVSTLFLTPTGRIRHRVLLVPGGDGVLLALLEPGSEGFPAWVDTYTFAEDCRVEPAGLHLAAAFGLPALARIPGPLDETGSVATDRGLAVARRDWRGLPVAWLMAERPEDLPTGLRELPELDARAWLQLRVEAGEPAMGAELTEERFPLEAGLLDEISFTKGCYTGQEVVARQDSYGKVTRRLVGLLFGTSPGLGEEIAGARGCAVTSVAPDPARARDGREGIAALGYVPARIAEPGSPVETASGLAGTVIELPFLPLD